MIKRRRDDDHVDQEQETPKKLRPMVTYDALTPSKPGRTPLADNGTPKSILKKSGFPNATPKSTRNFVIRYAYQATTPRPSAMPTVVPEGKAPDASSTEP